MRLNHVTAHDWQFLYDLLAERPHQANISHREMPDIATHVAFIKSNPYTAWYIIEVDHQHVTDDRIATIQLPAGAIYLSKQDEIGVAIKREHQGQHLDKQAIAQLMQRHVRPRYLANIAPDNMKSHKLFMGLGFKTIQNTLELRP